jgi:Flp pilus assembly protein CpaB
MSTEFGFLVIDANELVEKQQAIVRELVAHKINLEEFRRAERPPPTPAHLSPKRTLTPIPKGEPVIK